MKEIQKKIVNITKSIMSLTGWKQKQKTLVQPSDSWKYANKVFIQTQQMSKDSPIVTIYLPCYLRAKIKNFTSLDLKTLTASVNMTLIFSVYYGDIQQLVKPQFSLDIKKQLLNKIVFNFNRDDALEINQKLQITLKDEQNKKMFTYTIRKVFNMRITSQIFWSPFQIINLILTITIQKVAIKLNGEKCEIKFNLMDCNDNFLKLSYTQEGTFGLYDLAQSMLQAEYSQKSTTKKILQQNSQQRKKQLQRRSIASQDSMTTSMTTTRQMVNSVMLNTNRQKFNNFHYAHFTIPLYRFPFTSIATVFLPLILLGILNLGIFFQDKQLSGKISSIATLMIAFVALIPIIRQQTPPSPSITFIQILVFLQTSTSILCFCDSIRVMDIPNYVFVWYYNPFYLFSVFLNIASVVSIIFLYINHRYFQEPSYNIFLDEVNIQDFDRKKWYHQECSQSIKLYRKIKPMEEKQIPKKKQKKPISIADLGRSAQEREVEDPVNQQRLKNKQSQELKQKQE